MPPDPYPSPVLFSLVFSIIYHVVHWPANLLSFIFLAVALISYTLSIVGADLLLLLGALCVRALYTVSCSISTLHPDT